jgi:type II secretion system protein G
MDVPRAQRRPSAGQAGFTLLEVLIVVAIIGLLASVAIPALQDAMLKSKKSAAISDLRNLKDALTRYAADNGEFPEWGGLDILTLDQLVPTYVTNGPALLKNLEGKKLDWYIPWNPIDAKDMAFSWQDPQSYMILATLDYDNDVRFIVTDGGLYYYIDYHITPIGDS